MGNADAEIIYCQFYVQNLPPCTRREIPVRLVRVGMPYLDISLTGLKLVPKIQYTIDFAANVVIDPDSDRHEPDEVVDDTE